MGSDEQGAAILESLSPGLADGVSVQQLGGGRGRGFVTQRRFLRGERVLREAPLLLISSTEAEELEATEDGSLETLILGRLQENTEDSEAFWALDDCRCGGAAKSAVGIFQTNRMSLSEISGGDELVGEGGDEVTEAKTRHGLLLVGCLFRHSCCPNVYWSERAAQGEVVFHVLRDVEPGEELTMASAQAVLSMPAAMRHEVLSNWQLTCSCDSCSLTGAAQLASDGRRALLNFKMQQLGSSSVADLGNREDAQRARQAVERDPLQGLPVVREICGLLDEELSGHAPTKSWACIEGFALAESAGRQDLSLEFLELGYSENCVAEGEDSDNSQALALLLSQRKAGNVDAENAGAPDGAVRVPAAARAKPKRSRSRRSK